MSDEPDNPELDDPDLCGDLAAPPEPPEPPPEPIKGERTGRPKDWRRTRKGAKKGDRKKRNEKTAWHESMLKAGETKRTKEECLQALRDTEGFVARAAKSLGITSTTMKSYATRWPEVGELVEEYRRLRLEDVAEAGFELAVGKNGEEKNDRMIRFWLDRQKLAEELGFEKKYKDDKPTVQINIQNQTAILLSDEQKQDLLNGVKRRKMAEHDRRQMDEGLKELEHHPQDLTTPPTPE